MDCPLCGSKVEQSEVADECANCDWYHNYGGVAKEILFHTFYGKLTNLPEYVKRRIFAPNLNEHEKVIERKEH